MLQAHHAHIDLGKRVYGNGVSSFGVCDMHSLLIQVRQQDLNPLEFQFCPHDL
jgi:hypothetical protein